MNFNDFKSQIYDFSSNYSLGVDGAFSLEESQVKLLPIGSWILLEPAWIEKMVNGRKDFSDSFFIRFNPTHESMVRYLSEGAIADPKKILFLIVDQNRNLLGHLGLKLKSNDSFEVDNVMRLEKLPLGLMARSLQTMLQWVDEIFPKKLISLEVISTNKPAITLYKKMGFHIIKNIPLVEVVSANGFVSLKECEGNEAISSLFKVIMTKYPQPIR